MADQKGISVFFKWFSISIFIILSLDCACRHAAVYLFLKRNENNQGIA